MDYSTIHKAAEISFDSPSLEYNQAKDELLIKSPSCRVIASNSFPSIDHLFAIGSLGSLKPEPNLAVEVHFSSPLGTTVPADFKNFYLNAFKKEYFMFFDRYSNHGEEHIYRFQRGKLNNFLMSCFGLVNKEALAFAEMLVSPYPEPFRKEVYKFMNFAVGTSGVKNNYERLGRAYLGGDVDASAADEDELEAFETVCGLMVVGSFGSFINKTLSLWGVSDFEAEAFVEMIIGLQKETKDLN